MFSLAYILSLKVIFVSIHFFIAIILLKILTQEMFLPFSLLCEPHKDYHFTIGTEA